MIDAPPDPTWFDYLSTFAPPFVSLLLGAGGAWFAGVQQRKRLESEFGLQRERLRTELKLEFATETAIRELLSDPKFEEGKRTFERIKARLGGFDDKELRMHLVRAGAVSFKRSADGAELWGLRERTSAEHLSNDGEDAA